MTFSVVFGYVGLIIAGIFLIIGGIMGTITFIKILRLVKKRDGYYITRWLF